MAESSCKSCKHGLVITSACDDREDDFIFCFYIRESPLKFQQNRVVLQCNRYKEGEPDE